MNGGITKLSDAYFDNLYFNSAAPAASAITLDGYLSGNWYDPSQGGQGFQLEFTDQGSSLLAIWFVYTPDGSAQNWIYAQGAYDSTKSTVTLPAVILTGAKFPPLFKSSDVHTSSWGNDHLRVYRLQPRNGELEFHDTGLRSWVDAAEPADLDSRRSLLAVADEGDLLQESAAARRCGVPCAVANQSANAPAKPLAKMLSAGYQRRIVMS